MMMGNDKAIEFLECNIVDMLGDIDEETSQEFEKFANRVRYLVAKGIGKPPKSHKGNRVHDYWTCGNCGSVIVAGVNARFCDNCGFQIVWGTPRALFEL